MTTIGIGQLAKRSGVPIDTVRHYERIGLLKPAVRLASGYRRYGEAEQKRLRFIRRGKALGIHARGDPGAAGAERQQQRGSKFASARLRALRTSSAASRELARVRDSLRKLIPACPGHGRAEDCPILNALSRESEP